MVMISFLFEMMVVFGFLFFIVVLFVFEVVCIDFVVIFVMVLLGLLSQIFGLDFLVDVSQLFNGFVFNVVVLIIVVMIIGVGFDKIGLMSKVVVLILKYGGNIEVCVLLIVFGMVGVIFFFMQNVGVVVLFLFVVSCILVCIGLLFSWLLMLMGFCVIFGGIMIMVGLLLLIFFNDLILMVNVLLFEGQKMEMFSLFFVILVGISFVVVGILYFMIFGCWVLLGGQKGGDVISGQLMKVYLKKFYGLKIDIFEIIIFVGYLVVGQIFDDVIQKYYIYIIGSVYYGKLWFVLVIQIKIIVFCWFVVFGWEKEVWYMVEDVGFMLYDSFDVFVEDYVFIRFGVVEVVILLGLLLIGKCVYDVVFCKIYGVSMLVIYCGEEMLSFVFIEDYVLMQIGEVLFRVGDMLVILSIWEVLIWLIKDWDFVVVMMDFLQEEMCLIKVGWVLLFFVIFLLLILFIDLRLFLCLLMGVVGMILIGVFDIDDVYEVVSWSMVFFLVSLILFGQVVQMMGMVVWIVQQVVYLLDGWLVWLLQVGFVLMVIVFILIMFNVGVMVLLVLFVVLIVVVVGGDLVIFVMMVVILMFNFFLILIYQVNVLIMGLVGYWVMDFVKSGGIMMILFFVVFFVVMNVVFQWEIRCVVFVGISFRMIVMLD